MSNQNKLAILNAISAQATIGVAARLSFNSLGKTVHLSKTELDVLLTELAKERFVAQYAKKGVDGFTVTITQKGLDAVQDESFI